MTKIATIWLEGIQDEDERKNRRETVLSNTLIFGILQKYVERRLLDVQSRRLARKNTGCTDKVALYGELIGEERCLRELLEVLPSTEPVA